MKQKLKIYLAVLMAVLFCACSDDDLTEQVHDRTIVFGIGGKAYGLEWVADTQSRAGETLPADIPDSIGVFAYNDVSGEIFYNVKYCRETYNYPTNVISTGKPWTEANYKFIGYAPYSAGVSPDNSTFLGFSTLTNSNIPAYSTEPYYQSSLIEVTYPSTTSDFLKGDTVKMTLEHLTSRLRFCFKLDDKYGDLRIMHVKEVSVKPAGATEFMTLLNEKDSDGNRIDSVEISAAKEELGFQPLASLYVNPYVLEQHYTFTLRTRYDVFDKAGQLLRKDEESENRFNKNINLTEGKYYDVQILVEPNFLYVLSDNDVLEEAGITIN